MNRFLVLAGLFSACFLLVLMWIYSGHLSGPEQADLLQRDSNPAGRPDHDQAAEQPPSVSNAPPGEESPPSAELPAAASENLFEPLYGPDPSLDDVLQVATQVLENLRTNVRDYTAVLIKRERIGGKLGEEAKMTVKIRNPSQGSGPGLAVYLRFESPESIAGREVIWVDGQNSSKLVAHETGLKKLLGRIQLDPAGRLAMMGQKYPLTEIGLMRLAEKLIEKGEQRQRLQNAKIDVIGNQRVGDRECTLVQLTNPVDNGLAEFHVAQIFIDTERKIPLRYSAYNWPDKRGEIPPLEEEYTYRDVRLNVGLTPVDFDPDNPAYDFP